MAVLSNKDAFLAKALKTIDVEIDGLGTVRLRAWSVGDREAVFASLSADKGLIGNSALLRLQVECLSRAIIGEDGKPFLSRADIAEMAPEIVDRLYDEFNKLTAPVITDAAIEDAAGN